MVQRPVKVSNRCPGQVRHLTDVYTLGYANKNIELECELTLLKELKIIFERNDFMSVLVTGGAGFIGTHTCVELLNNNEEIVVVDNLSNSKFEAIKRVEELTGKKIKFYKVDLLDEALLQKVFDENTIESVIHFAGLKAVGESVEKPLLYYQNNVSGTTILLKVMSKYNIKKIVFSSSATVYGTPKEVPIKEDFPLSTANPYGTTKLMIEQILEDVYNSDNEWSIALLRYFNPIGAHKSGKIGENPNGIPNNIMPRLLNVALGKVDSLTVYGNDYPTKDGTGVRDYIHITDLSIGHLKALERIRKQKGIDSYNLGTGIGYSVFEIINTFEKSTGVKLKYHITPRRPGDIAEYFSDPTKAKKLLGWEAKLDLAQMCTDAWNFAKNNVNGPE